MSSNRKKILWLASWYPNKYDLFDGDFIQRHARAAAIHNDVHVIVVKESPVQKRIEEEWHYATGLTEQVIYYKTGNGLFSKIRKQLKWRQLYLNAADTYIKKNGLPNVIHVHVPWKSGLIALELKRKYHLDLITSEHWGIYDPSLESNYLSKSAIFKQSVRKVFENSKVICLPSEYLGTCLDKMVLKKNRILIPNVVDTTLFFLQEKKYSKFTFIHVSNMEPVKNVGGIIDAFTDLVTIRGIEDVELILIGNRDNNMKNYADQKGLLNKSIFFKGEIPYADVAKEMQLAHCFILNSETETFSCVTAEALCCGIPVIAPNVGSLPELVDDSNGILTNSHEKHSLVNSLLEMKEHYSKYDSKAIAHAAQKKYNYGTIGEQFDHLYRSL